MAYDVARVRGLHPSLGDGWVHLDAQLGMLVPDSVATTVSTAFRGSRPDSRGPHPAARRSAAVLEAARQAVADLVNADPRGVVLGADRAVLLGTLADAVGVAGRPRLRSGGHPARRRGKHRAVAARGKPLRCPGQVGRGRHRNRRPAGVAVGELGHEGHAARCDHVGVVDARHCHRPACRHETRARRRWSGGGRPLVRRPRTA